MKTLATTLIAVSMTAFAAVASAQVVDTRQPQPSALKPAPENTATGANTRADVKAETKAAASDKPVDQTGLKKSDKPMAEKTRAEVKAETKASKTMTGTKETPIPAPDAKNTSAVAPAVAK